MTREDHVKTYREKPVVVAHDRKVRRKWPERHHDRESSAWLVIFHKSSDTPSVYYDEAVELAKENQRANQYVRKA